MRKAVNISLTLVLLFSITGLSVSRHYCMGQLKAQWIGQTHQEICIGMESTPGMEGCCSNETETYVLDEDFSSTSFEFQTSTDYHVLYAIAIVEASEWSEEAQINSIIPQDTGPPFIEPDIFIQVQSFLL